MKRFLPSSLKKAAAIIGLCGMSGLSAYAQAPAIEWQKTLGGSGNDGINTVQHTADGGYIMGGASHSPISGDKTQASKGGDDYWIVKLDASGAKVWDKTFGGSGNEYLLNIQQTTDGGYLLGGYSQSGISGDKTEASRGGDDYWVVKINSSGTKVWDKTFGGSGSDIIFNVQQSIDGGYFLGGTSTSGISGDKTEAGKGSSDYWVIKTDASGAKVWDKTFGGSGSDDVREMALTSDGGCIVGGFSTSGISGNKTEASRGSNDYWVVKLSSSGTKAWDKTIGSSGSDLLTGLQQTTDGGYLLGGYAGTGTSGDKTDVGKGNQDFWIVKLNSSGTKMWDKTFGGTGNDYLYKLRQTTDSGFILGGPSQSGISGDKSEANNGSNDYWAVKVNATGVKEWDKTVGGSANDENTDLQQSADGGYFLGGLSNSGISGGKTEASKGGYDHWVIKLAGPAVVSAGTITTTNNLSAAYGPGAGIRINFKTTGTFNSGNTFTAQLSNANGSFASPTNLVKTGGSSRTIKAIIPANTPAGTGYRVRVISTNPVVIGSDNGSNISIVVPVYTITTVNNLNPVYYPGGNIRVYFNKKGAFTNSTTYQVQLSNAAGSFASPTILPVIATYSSSVKATIPAATPLGNGYRVRVVSTNPNVTGTDNGSNISIQAVPVRLAQPQPAIAATEADQKLSVYPNPAQADQTVTLRLAESLTGAGVVYVYDLLGKQVMQQSIAENQKERILSLKGLKTGLYQIKVISGNQINSTKLIVQ